MRKPPSAERPAREEAAIDLVDRLHRAVDAMTAPLLRKHAARLRCARGCTGCCSDGLTVFEVEAAAIARKHRALLESGAPHAAGACAFLDEEGACRVYEERPYVCRTQGLPLSWIDEAVGELREHRDICPLNEAGGPAIEALPREECWAIGPVEAKLAELQASRDGGELRRVALRDLFARSAPVDRVVPLGRKR